MAATFNVAIIGLGLMGGSLGLALRRRGGVKVNGYARREEIRRAALERGAADRVFAHPDEAVRGAQLVVICTPVNLIVDMAAACAPGLDPRSVVTDVGSSKGEIVAQLDDFFSGGIARFVGSHPIAGSERQGLDAAQADLYRDAVVALTPSEMTDPGALSMVRDFWSSLSARVCELAPHEHDRLLAGTSHLPHLVAVLLADTVGRGDAALTGRFCGSGFRDTTRVADGDPLLWHDILQTNRTAVLRELQEFGQRLEALVAALETRDLVAVQGMLAQARARRRALLAMSRTD